MNIATCNACVPSNIKRVIEARGLKQGRLAERAGYTPQQLTDMLWGRKLIKPCDILSIAKALGVAPNDLFAEEET